LGILPREQFINLRRFGGTHGHPDVSVPGIEANSGSLGMGISKAKGIALAKTLNGHKGRVLVMTGDGELQEGQIWESLQTTAHQKINNVTAIVDFNNLWQQERIIKGTLLAASPDEKAKADDFYRYFDSNLSFSWTNTPAYPGVDFINVLDPGVSKGRALEALVAFLGIDLSEVMAIGDGANDASLLSKAGLAIAMGNASDELKAIADREDREAAARRKRIQAEKVALE